MTTRHIVTIRDGGFGYITRDDTRDDAATTGDLFFHRTGVAANGFDQLRVGQHVRFDEEPDPRDPTRRRAVQVAPLVAEAQASAGLMD
jgi:cold shock CspA family protein